MPKQPVAPIAGPRLRLRPLDVADLPTTLAWRNQDRIRRWFLHSDPIPWERHQAWFRSYLERDDDYLFVIETADRPRTPVGQLGLSRIDWNAGSAELGRVLIGEPTAQRKGLATEATRLLLDFAFGTWGLRTIELDVLADNARALRLYRRCGFEPVSEEGGLVRMRVTAERSSQFPAPSSAA